MEDKIIELLGRGYSQTVVASAVGCEDSYISQLMAREDIRSQVATLRLQHVAGHVEMDDSVDSLEAKAMEKLQHLLPFVTKPMDALRIYQVANAAKRKTEGATATNTESRAPVVQVSIPVHVAMQFRLDSSKQVVEINGKSMAALPSATLNKRLEERRTRQPLLTDSASAASMLNNLEKFPADSIANVL